MWPGGCAHARNHMRKGLFGFDMPPDDADEVESGSLMQPLGNLEGFLQAQSTLKFLVANHADADDIRLTDLLADFLQHFQSKAHAVLQTAPVGVGALVRQRRPEGIE